MQIATGTEIGGYRIVHLLGQGGMGVVYLAEKVRNGQRVALKLLTPDLARSPGFRERFVREAGYARSLKHPNVLQVYDAGEEDGVLYIAMQYVEGEDLKALLMREGRLDARRATNILGQVASALDAAHATGLMHRDVKPGNVMIAAGQPERCYLTDFGLSKNPSADSIALTAQGEFVGTIDYTAPELVLGKGADSRLDVYSLGCLFYECLAGQPPFPKERDVEVLYAHIQDPPPRVSEVRPDVPPALDDVIVKAMAKKPDDRYPTCTAFIDAAKAIVGDPAPPSTPPPPPPPPPLGDQTPPTEPLPRAGGAIALRVMEGPALGSVLTVADDELLIGRQAPGPGKLGNDIEISRRHARVTREPGGAFLIEDLGSTNGTFVNGERILGTRVLNPGDVLEMGDTKLRAEALDPPSEEIIAPAGPPAATELFETPPEPQPEPEPEPEPAPPLLVASSGSVSVRVEGTPGGDLDLHLDDGGHEAHFVRRDGSWTVPS